MEVLFIAVIGLVLFGAVGAVVFAVVRIGKNTKKQSAAPENSVFAKVTKAYSQENTNYSLDASNADTVANYYVEFLLPDKSKKTFKISKKRFAAFTAGDTGNLLYKGNKLIDFQKVDRTPSPHTKASKSASTSALFFQHQPKTGPVLKFYADNPGVGVSVPASAPIDCDFNEVAAYINRLFGSNTDNFFGLEKATGEILQFSNDGRGGATEIDIPLPGGYSYKGMLQSPGELLACVRDFYSGTDIVAKYRLTREKQ